MNADSPMKVLRAMLAEPNAKHHYVNDLMETTGLKSGDVYPALAHWEAAGIVFSDWDPSPEPGGPRRRYYSLSSYGRLHGEHIDFLAYAQPKDAQERPSGEEQAML